MPGLTDLQQSILQLFFSRRREFFLTGGAALSGFHLGHRVTHDLDLFTAAQQLDDGERTVREIADELALRMETLRRAVDFRRFLLQSQSEGVVIDLVRDLAPQLRPKVEIGGILVDSAEEILANKLCALLSRVEVRDLFDVSRLAAAGFDPIAAVPLAASKDGGVSAAQLAWVLSTYPIPDGVESLFAVSRAELDAFRLSLAERLAAAAFPKPRTGSDDSLV
jgi:hypothetical protein